MEELGLPEDDKPKSIVTFMFDITDFSEEEYRALIHEVIVQGEKSDIHPESECIDFRVEHNM